MLGEPLRNVRPAFRVRSFRVTGYLRQDLGIRLCDASCLSSVARASFYADSGVRVSTPPFEPIGDVTREAKLTAYA